MALEDLVVARLMWLRRPKVVEVGLVQVSVKKVKLCLLRINDRLKVRHLETDQGLLEGMLALPLAHFAIACLCSGSANTLLVLETAVDLVKPDRVAAIELLLGREEDFVRSDASGLVIENGRNISQGRVDRLLELANLVDLVESAHISSNMLRAHIFAKKLERLIADLVVGG